MAPAQFILYEDALILMNSSGVKAQILREKEHSLYFGADQKCLTNFASTVNMTRVRNNVTLTSMRSVGYSRRSQTTKETRLNVRDLLRRLVRLKVLSTVLCP